MDELLTKQALFDKKIIEHIFSNENLCNKDIVKAIFVNKIKNKYNKTEENKFNRTYSILHRLKILRNNQLNKIYKDKAKEKDKEKETKKTKMKAKNIELIVHSLVNKIQEYRNDIEIMEKDMRSTLSAEDDKKDIIYMKNKHYDGNSIGLVESSINELLARLIIDEKIEVEKEVENMTIPMKHFTKKNFTEKNNKKCIPNEDRSYIDDFEKEKITLYVLKGTLKYLLNTSGKKLLYKITIKNEVLRYYPDSEIIKENTNTIAGIIRNIIIILKAVNLINKDEKEFPYMVENIDDEIYRISLATKVEMISSLIPSLKKVVKMDEKEIENIHKIFNYSDKKHFKCLKSTLII